MLSPRAWLDAHVNLETGVGVPAPARRERGAPTLERIGTLLQYLGSPQLEYPAIHLTGTNGKTSTTRMITELLSTVGLLGRRVHEPAPAARQRAHRPQRRARSPTASSTSSCASSRSSSGSSGSIRRTSKSLTGAAFRWFADVAVDVAVVEVGLGGTWDATNVIDGEVAVVTNVSLDHTQYLGDDVRARSPPRRPAS